MSNTQATTITVDAVSAPNLTDQQRQQLKLEVQPGTLIDANGNVSEVRYDPLGVVIAVTSYGHAGDSMSFLARSGPSTIQYAAGAPSMIQLGPDAYPLPPTRGYAKVRVNVARSGRVELRCLQGAVNLDRMDHE